MARLSGIVAMCLVLASSMLPKAYADCSHYGDCVSCAAAKGWDGQCRWCPKDNGCHDPGSLFNHCSKSSQITNVFDCPAGPSPSPPVITPVDTSTLDPAALLQKIFDALKISADASKCVNDVGAGSTHLRDFSAAVTHKNASVAATELSAALSAFASSVNDCQVPALQAKLDALAARLHFAKISEVDGVIHFIIGTSELWEDLEALAAAVTSKDVSAVATALAKLETDWSAVVCASPSSACNLVDGLLRILGIVANDLSGTCAADLEGAVATFQEGAQAFANKNYTGGVSLFAGGLDTLAVAIDTDACGISGLAAALKLVAPKLEAAIVNETAGVVKIVVGSAEVYEELYQAAEAFSRGDWVSFGEQMGLLLQKLRASGCQSKACDLLEGLLAALQIEATDYAQCVSDIDAAFGDFENAVTALEEKQWVAGAGDLGKGLESLATAVSGCGIPELAKVVEQVATDLGDAAVATAIGEATQVLVNGADVVDDLAQAQVDWASKNYRAFGADLGAMSAALSATGCKLWVCRVAEGLLSQLGIFFADLQTCEDDLKSAETDIVAGAQAWAAKDYKTAITSWSKGIHVVAQSLSDCGLANTTLANEANVLGISVVAAEQVLVRGVNFFDDLVAAEQAIEHHDYRAAGQEIGQVLNLLAQWTSKHSCSSDLCYLVTGVLEFMSDIEGSIKDCEMDFVGMWSNFTSAYHDLTNDKSVLWEFSHDTANVKKAIGEIGRGFEDLGNAVGDCHLQELSEIIAAVAAKLGLSPEVEVVEEALKILIDGVQIEEEVGLACEDYSESNWVGFGYNIAKLLKMLL